TAASREEALDALRAAAPDIPPPSDGPVRVAFLLPGGGTQYPGMGAELYRDHAVYRDTVDECARILRPALGADVRTALFEDRRPDDTAAFLGLVVTEYALARTLMEQGVRPDALIGHSLGEYTAACLAGVVDLEDMLPLVTERIRLISSAGGATVGVAAPAEDVRPLLDDGLSLAAVNGPSACTVAGHLDAVTRFEAELTRRGVPFRRLRIPVAAHSHVLDPVLPVFEGHLRQVTLRPPRIPYVTNVTGTWVTDDQATSVRHWIDHTRNTVRFADGIAALWERQHPVLVEIGPGDTLTKLATGRLADEAPVTVTTMRHAKAEASDGFVLAEALGRLWSAGVDAALPPAPDRARRVPLPPYAFDRRRHWIDAPGARTDPAAPDTPAPARAETALAPRPRLTTEHVPPRSEREQEVTRLWEQTLGIGGIGVHDNFFDLGGDSMRAVLLAGRLRQAGVLDVPAAELLAAPSVAGVLAAADRRDGD
ncbi:acyltransferase domain-containing protein, partial [Streptomyces sp. 8P21H-1]|uniref:acyltransferase domain-containing protein n=1 Tax=Streptomyces sp. 8P21H-1 TaxID=2737048 RepID=UPI0015708495